MVRLLLLLAGHVSRTAWTAGGGGTEGRGQRNGVTGEGAHTSSAHTEGRRGRVRGRLKEVNALQRQQVILPLFHGLLVAIHAKVFPRDKIESFHEVEMHYCCCMHFM